MSCEVGCGSGSGICEVLSGNDFIISGGNEKETREREKERERGSGNFCGKILKNHFFEELPSRVCVTIMGGGVPTEFE